ncbi:C10 family peptidase [Lentimicrobium sp. S6]|uniref:C10 family peptidase n=1 Tax=Lentimicrobium sp. S6 TaxID=2735872 RepID=UPI0015526BE0|nr:C10 family peptidase [Lentimicrobium sp. S6]NPD43987.1 T9SS type A sorting domain-containing protein [Lentimicrobium sp. S6]
MKKLILFFSILLFTTVVLAQQVDKQEAIKVGKVFLNNTKSNIYSLKDYETCSYKGGILYHIVNLSPAGYALVSNGKDFAPILAYSLHGKYEKNNNNPLHQLICADFEKRAASEGLYLSKFKDENNKSWAVLLSGKSNNKSSLSWPELGTTSTEGWVEAQWSQSAPYNAACPMDPIDNARSIAGCPSITMAQILDFHKTINEKIFSDEDDYFHNYSGRQYDIDDDFEELDFPSFPELNTNLNSLQNSYSVGINPSNLEIANLVFACGVACTQVYSSSASGTFGVNQAADAYGSFNCSNSELLYPNMENLYERMAFNMRHALPIHLAVVNDAMTVGHNVVLDGWNEDNFYHVNFGWGGSYDSWYHIPDDLPYELTVIEGVVLDILLENMQNTAPFSSDIIITCNENVEIDIVAETFINAYSDAELDTIMKIKITELPSFGVLDYNGSLVIIGQEIDFSSFSQMTYSSNSNPAVDDHFKFQVYDGFEYSEEATFQTLFDITALGEDKSNLDFELFPIPCSNELSISFERNSEQSVIKIYSIVGEEQLRVSTREQQVILQLNGFSDGIYFVEIEQNNESLTKKIIVKK